MKILTWVLLVFSGIGILGLLTETNPDEGSLWGLIYAGMVLIQGIMVLMHLKEIEKDSASKKVI